MYFDQQEYDVRFEWGLAGIEALAPVSDVIVIVDVLSFSTSVDVAVGNGAIVYPYRGPADELAAFAAAVNAQAVNPGREQAHGYTLAPSSLTTIPSGTRLVLPSPNGSTLSLATGDLPTLAGCLRNAAAVARRAAQLGRRISVIAAGERWPGPRLRPALEDLLGAGAIIERLAGSRSPEADMAAAAFRHAEPSLEETLLRCGSGKELVGARFCGGRSPGARLNTSGVAPQLIGGVYRAGMED